MKYVIILSFLFLLGCQAENNKEKTIPKQEVPQHKFIEKSQVDVLFEMHNKERTSRGLQPLILDKKLTNYAQKHAEYMSVKNSLVHSSMSSLQKVNNDSFVGENIAWGQETEKEVINSWMWSPGHRWNILGSSYKKIGIGIKKDKNNRLYWCVVFSS